MTKARASIHQPFSGPVCVFFLQVSVILKVTQRLIGLTARFSQSEVVLLSNTSKSKKKKKKKRELDLKSSSKRLVKKDPVLIEVVSILK